MWSAKLRGGFQATFERNARYESIYEALTSVFEDDSQADVGLKDPGPWWPIEILKLYAFMRFALEDFYELLTFTLPLHCFRLPLQ